MSATIPSPSAAAPRRDRRSLLVRIATGIAIAAALFAIFGFFVAPIIVKSKLEEILTEKSNRKVAVERVRVNPFTLSAAVEGFVMRERDADAPFVTFDELFVDASIASVYRLAPVLDRVRLTKPHVRVIRYDDKRYNFQDLVDAALSAPKSKGPPPKFSVNNIELLDGRIDLDDRPEKKKHEVTDLAIGVPFVSNLPYAVDIDVQPSLVAKVNGSPLEVKGETKPFKDTRETSIALDFDRIDLPRYADYSPVPLPVKLNSGELDTNLALRFETGADNALRTLTLSGNAEVRKLDVVERGGAPVAGLQRLTVELEQFDAIANALKLKSVRVEAPVVHVVRRKDGSINLVALAPPPTPVRPGEQPAKPLQFSIAHVQLVDGRVMLADQEPESRPFETDIRKINIDVQNLSNATGARATVKAGYETTTGATFGYDGDLQLQPIAADGRIDVKSFRLADLFPYYESLLNLQVDDGTLDLDARVALGGLGPPLDLRVTDLNAAVRSLKLTYPGEKAPLWTLAAAEVRGGVVDVGKQRITLDDVAARDAFGHVKRDKDGTLNLARIIKTTPQTGTTRPAAGADADWVVEARNLKYDRVRVVYEDLALTKPVKVVVDPVSGTYQNYSNARGAKGSVAFSATINGKGRLAVTGPMMMNPIAGNVRVDLRGLELTPFQPYLDEHVNVAITGGAAATRGQAAFDLTEGKQKVSYGGDINITDFSSIDKPTQSDLLKWKTLYLGKTRTQLEPLAVTVDEVALTDFYSRLILNADGTLNVQNLLARPGDPKRAAAGVRADGTRLADAAKPAEERPLEEQFAGEATESGRIAGPQTDTGPRTATVPGGAKGPPPNVGIGKITLAGGNINFSDFFIKPNYSANLTGIAGVVGKLTPETPGDLELRGKVENIAPVEIVGRINPLSTDLFADIKASAKDIELPPLTPYSMKYAGYGIEKGKLSMEVKYLIENRKLAAENRVVLDQLTFGEKVESPTATKLPVLLAVALLKDRNGVIDINLPISGSIDDPKFSVGGIILRVLVNLIVKAVTSPFALIGAMVGGGEELAYVEFAPGLAKITPEAEAKLKNLAKALNDRPALKMDIAGRVDPETDREGLRKASIDRQVRAQKARELGKGVDAKDVSVDPAEYPKYLTAAYKAADFPKPRNIIGLAKDLPVPEMEALMLTNATATDEDLRQLANERAQAVKDWLVETAKIPTERVFLIAPKMSADGIKDKGKPARADFSLK